MNAVAIQWRRAVGIALAAAAALLIHGYHPYAEDAEIYLPGILKLLDPRLFPLNAEFFHHHAGYSLYPRLIAGTAQLSHLPLEWVAFAWHAASIVLLLAGTWRLASAFFEHDRERWGAVALMAALLTLPIAGTALYILDQYLNPRNLAAFAALFGLAEALHRKYVRAALWLAFCGAVHPLMASFVIAFVIWLPLVGRIRFMRKLGFAALLPPGLFAPASPAYHEVALRQPYFFVLRWDWYEWLGLIGPILLFCWLGRFSRQRGMAAMEKTARAMVPYILVATVAAIVLCIPGPFETVARFEPLRCLALSYMVLIIMGGGLLARYVLKTAVWRWIALFLPLCVGMYAAQRQLFPASAHVEWPWAKPRNPWVQAFQWIRANTPTDAFFALNPRHMQLPGEDENGFRACAERSMLGDAVKDKGAASAFPPLADRWLEQYRAQEHWATFTLADFENLRQKYGIGWLVIEQPGLEGMNCPYQNSAVRVCRLD